MIKRSYFIFAYMMSWVLFGAVALAFNLASAAALLIPRRHRSETAAAEAIRILFRIWVGWLRLTGLVRITWHGPRGADLPKPAVYVANHPGLLDATMVLAHIPAAVCLFKPALLRNPFLGAAARLAGYPAGNLGLDLVHSVSDKIAQGRTLLLFPEGTRTRPDVALNPVKPGFALIARCARAPVQVLVIEASRDLLPKGRSWWRIPKFPARVSIHVDRLIGHDPDRSTGETTAEVAGRLAARLGASS